MLDDVIAMAAGRREPELLLINVQVLNVFSGDLETTHVAVGHEVIVGMGQEYDKAQQGYDLRGSYLLPGLIDGHVHLESSLLSRARSAEAVVPHGTTTVVADPHEIANVAEIAGLQYMLHATEHLPLEVYFMVPPLCAGDRSFGPSSRRRRAASSAPKPWGKMCRAASTSGLGRLWICTATPVDRNGRRTGHRESAASPP